MFEALGSSTYRYRFLIVGAWIAAAFLCYAFAPSIASQGTADQASFLPASAPSAVAQAALDRAFPASTSTSSATISFSRDSGLTDADFAYLDAFGTWSRSADAPKSLREAVTSVDSATTRPELASMLKSSDGKLALLNVNLNVSSAGDSAAAVVSALRDHAAATSPAGLAVHVTGAAGITTDYLQAIKDGTSSTTLVTVILVLVMLLLIYRAPLAAVVPLATIGGAFLVARGVLGFLAAAGWQISSLLDTFVVVLVFGVGTDYTIFLISRYREEVREGDWHDASRRTVRRIGAVISASAATVIVGLGSMAFGNFQMIQTMGPALAVAIFVTLLAGLTLAPALLAIFGHYLFWPLHSRTGSDAEPDGFFAHLADTATRHPVVISAAIVVALVVPAALMPQMRTNFDTLAELPSTSDARLGYDQVAEHLGKGKLVQSTGLVDVGPGGDALSPASLSRLRDTLAMLSGTRGVGSVTSLVTPDGDGKVPAGFTPSTQLITIGDSFSSSKDGSSGSSAGSSGPSGGSSGRSSILDPSVSSGLSQALDYVNGLGLAFPDVAARSEFRAATAAITDAESVVDRARTQSVVSTQLRTLASALTSPTSIASAGSGASAGTSLISDYLKELSTAYPDVRTMPAFSKASTAAASLRRGATASAAIDAASALNALAVHFDSTPRATLEAKSLANTASALEAKRQATAAFDAIPAAMKALGSLFAGRSDDIFVPVGLGGSNATSLQQAVDAFVSPDRTVTRFYLTVSDDPYSTVAFGTVRAVTDELTAAAPDFGPRATAVLGGSTAVLADVQTVLETDFQRVGVITVIGIFLVLVILLRALVAPLYLVATVLLSYGSAVGLSSWLFQGPFGQPGVSFYLPLIVFVLLVALGSDYNIFLMSRVREEGETRSLRDGIRVASGRTGAVITSAGLILAGTFGSMATAPLAVLFQIGLAVAIGVLIDTFVVRSILVPAITTVVGARAWWPSGVGIRALAPAGAASGPAPAPARVLLGSVDEPAPRSPVRIAIAVLLAALVPITFAGLIMWAHPTTAPVVHAAVVNGDEGTAVSAGDGTSETLRLGTDLATTLAASRPSDLLQWRATDATSAANGLADGTYDAILTIPAGYSKAVVAFEGDRSGTQQSPTLHLETNTDSTTQEIAQSLSAAISATASRSIATSYVGDVLLAVSTRHDQLQAAATTAHDIATRTASLAADASGIKVVTGEVTSGLAALASGTTKAVDGAKQLASGTKALAGGANQLATGAASLASGAADAAKGASQLSSGAASLAGGLATLDVQTSQLPAQVSALDTGAASLASGAASTAAGAASLSTGLATLRTQTTGMGAQAAQLNNGAAGVAAGASSVAAGASQAAAGAATLAGGASTLEASVDGYAGSVAALAATCDPLDALCVSLKGLVAVGNAPLTAGAHDLASGAADAATGAAALSVGAAGVASGASDLHGGTALLAAQAPQLETGIAQLAAGGASLAAGTTSLASGASSLADGAHQLAAAAPALADGVSQLASAAAKVSDGSASLATGVSGVASGARGVAGGTQKTASAAASLAAGTASSASGAAQLSNAMGQAVDGSRAIETEIGNVAADGKALADDAAEAASSLDSQASSAPSYAGSTRIRVASAVTQPVSVEAVATNGAPPSGLAPYIAALALWLGALSALAVMPRARHLNGRAALRATVASFAAAATLGVAGAILMVAGLLSVGQSIADVPRLLAISGLAELAFVAIVQLLVVAFGLRGWLVGLLLVAVQVAASGLVWPVGALPAPLASVHPLLPMSWASDAMAAVIAGGTAGIGPQVLALAACLAVAVLFMIAIAAGPRRPSAGPGAAERTHPTSAPA